MPKRKKRIRKIAPKLQKISKLLPLQKDKEDMDDINSLIGSFIHDYNVNGLQERKILKFGLDFMEKENIQASVFVDYPFLLFAYKIMIDCVVLSDITHLMAVLIFKKTICILFKLDYDLMKQNVKKKRTTTEELQLIFSDCGFEFSQLDMKSITEEFNEKFKRNKDVVEYVREIISQGNFDEPSDVVTNFEEEVEPVNITDYSVPDALDATIAVFMNEGEDSINNIASSVYDFGTNVQPLENYVYEGMLDTSFGKDSDSLEIGFNTLVEDSNIPRKKASSTKGNSNSPEKDHDSSGKNRNSPEKDQNSSKEDYNLSEEDTDSGDEYYIDSDIASLGGRDPKDFFDLADVINSLKSKDIKKSLSPEYFYPLPNDDDSEDDGENFRPTTPGYVSVYESDTEDMDEESSEEMTPETVSNHECPNEIQELCGGPSLFVKLSEENGIYEGMDNDHVGNGLEVMDVESEHLSEHNSIEVMDKTLENPIEHNGLEVVDTIPENTVENNGLEVLGAIPENLIENNGSEVMDAIPENLMENNVLEVMNIIPEDPVGNNSSEVMDIVPENPLEESDDESGIVFENVVAYTAADYSGDEGFPELTNIQNQEYVTTLKTKVYESLHDIFELSGYQKARLDKYLTSYVKYLLKNNMYEGKSYNDSKRFTTEMIYKFTSFAKFKTTDAGSLLWQMVDGTISAKELSRYTKDDFVSKKPVVSTNGTLGLDTQDDEDVFVYPCKKCSTYHTRNNTCRQQD
uniref:MI domain-containing protein n=1 Tax=Strongyloides venezuelensis TaxID=75913 RepID=A0A0K0G1X6_STRVS